MGKDIDKAKSLWKEPAIFLRVLALAAADGLQEPESRFFIEEV
jgi:hypothetical protein